MQDGYTLTHEHMTIALSPGDLGTDSFDALCGDLRELYGWGVRRIVDLTNPTMGRDPDYTRRLSQATGIRILNATGYYLEPDIPASVDRRSIQDLAAEALRELRDGTAAVIGEIAWSPEPGPRERKTWEAMCLAARETGAPVFTHPSLGPQQLLQAEYLISRGVDPGRIVIGHIEFFPSDEALRRVLETGVYIGLDMIGKDGPDRDEYRADLVRTVIGWGYGDRLLLSTDLCRRRDLKACGGYGYGCLFREFLPRLERRGVTRQQMDLLLKANPDRLLGPVGGGPGHPASLTT